MSFGLGLKVLKRLCQEQNPLLWNKAKLDAVLFKTPEVPVFEWVESHMLKYHALPQVETLCSTFPDLTGVVCPEPTGYYIEKLENAYFHSRINRANLESQETLKEDQDAHEKAASQLREALDDITKQKYRAKILNMGVEGPQLVMDAYHKVNESELKCEFGWHYMDKQSGGMVAGDVASFIGRPAMGKTWKMLYTAIHNWKVKKNNVLFVSMEMDTLSIAQRVASMYAHTNIAQLKMSGYSSPVYKKFSKSMTAMASEAASLYIINGNLAASVEDIYSLAHMLKCRVVGIDGAYLLRHKNAKLDRFTRAAENVELMKRTTGEIDAATFASWQFNREAAKKSKKKGEEAGVEDIGYSDAIGQISSIVLALFQDDGIETMHKRTIKVLKGRNGEVGQFEISWDFAKMNFDQVQFEAKVLTNL